MAWSPAGAPTPGLGCSVQPETTLPPIPTTSATAPAGEFGFDLARCVVIEHEKPRVGGACDRHWHLLVPEWDPVRRRVLDSKWMYPRQEKIARAAEIRLGHQLVAGRWNAAVARAFDQEGHIGLSETVSGLVQETRPGSAYTSKRHQTATRRDVSLPHTRATVRQAWTEADTVESFATLLAETRLALRPGDTDGVWLVQVSRDNRANAVLVGALHRLVRLPVASVNERLQGLNAATMPR